MKKTKIRVLDVLPCAGKLDVAVVKMNDGSQEKTIHICIPNSCGVSKYIGEEIYYEFKNGNVKLSQIRASRLEDEETQGEAEYKAGEA